MVEIINRKSRMEKEQDNRTIQVSYNSFGHLAIRIFDKEAKEPVEDKLIVFTMEETQKIIRFVQNLFPTRDPYGDC